MKYKHTHTNIHQWKATLCRPVLGLGDWLDVGYGGKSGWWPWTWASSDQEEHGSAANRGVSEEWEWRCLGACYVLGAPMGFTEPLPAVGSQNLQLEKKIWVGGLVWVSIEAVFESAGVVRAPGRWVARMEGRGTWGLTFQGWAKVQRCLAALCDPSQGGVWCHSARMSWSFSGTRNCTAELHIPWRNNH